MKHPPSGSPTPTDLVSQTRLSMPETSVRQKMKVTGMTAKSANTSIMHQKKKEMHRKTMLKVMDPNVH